MKSRFFPGVRFSGPLLFLMLGSFAPAGEEKSLTAAADKLLSAEWSRQKLQPSPPADDAEFLRRATLDLTGTIPTLAESVAFFQNNDAKKREKKIDELLNGPAYAEYWASTWSKLLTLPTTSTYTRDALTGWLKESFAANMPFDDMVEQLIAGSGNPDVPGPAAFVGQIYRAGNNPNMIMPALTTRIGKAFMGIQLTCAQCHNDPYREWTQMDFWGATAFLARTRLTQDGLDDVSHGELATPEELKKPVRIKANEEPESYRSRTVPVRLFSDERTDIPSGRNRRTALARWITSSKNPYFSKAVANRYWGLFFGRGIVDPIDDSHSKNPPTHPELLDLLARGLADVRYDLKKFIRSILLTRAYQISSQKSGRGREEDQAAYFARARLRSMSSEQLLNTFVRATGYEDMVKNEIVTQNPKMSEDPAELKKQMAMRMFQVRREFEKYFNAAEGPENPHAAEQDALQASLFLKSSIVHAAATRAPGNMLDKIMDAFPGANDRVKAMYLTVLSRHPSPSELAMATQFVATKPKDRYEDLFWALLNASEFLFIH